MELNQIYSIIITILTIISGFMSLVYKSNCMIKEKAVDLINKAEEEYMDTSRAGGRKFSMVVNQLYDITPQPLHLFITREMIENVVQKAFDGIESYAIKQTKNRLKRNI